MKQQLRTPLAKARGLGSARGGTQHFLWQRITAVVLIPLSVWFVYSLLHVAINADQDGVVQWLISEFNTAALIIMLLALFYHSAIGMQVIIEDYVHEAGSKLTLLLVNKLTMFVFAAISILAVLKLHFQLVPQGIPG